MSKPVAVATIVFMCAMLASSDATAASPYLIEATFQEGFVGTPEDFFSSSSSSFDCCTLDGDEDPEDWFSWTAPAAGSLNVIVLFLDNEIDIDLEVFNSSLARLDGSYTTTDVEEVTVELQAGSQVFIKPYVFEEFGTNSAYLADAYEPNDSAEEAFLLPEAPLPAPALSPSGLFLLALGLGLTGLAPTLRMFATSLRK